MRPTAQEDRRLLSKCLAGDRGAWEKFVTRFSGLVYISVRDTLSSRGTFFSREDFEDLHNTVFLHLFENNCRKLSQYQGRNGCSPASWLRVVTVRMALNYVRDRGVHKALREDSQESFENLSDQDREVLGPLALMEKAERQQALQDAMEFLSPRDRLFMKLHFEDGLVIEEVAEALSISIQNAYTVKHRAVQRLRSYLIHKK